ncbi:MAG: cytochrome P450 [Kofleriaceae bacterium]|nr:cytochrome P450 [Kofleriaceae bacterium]MCL4226862.1 cytochrome P450 [Myxococcales bacterium]
MEPTPSASPAVAARPRDPRAALAIEPGLPLVGNLLDFRRDRLGLQVRAVRKAQLTRLRLLTRTAWLVGDHELAQQVLVTDEDSFIKGPALGEVARPLLGNGLLTAEKEDHRRQRKLMAPAFTPRRIAGYGQVMAARAQAAAQALRPHAMIDLAAEMMGTTLDIVGRTLFDVDLHGEAKEIGEALTACMEYMVKAGMWLVPASLPLPANRRLRAAVARLDATVLRVIAQRRAALARGADDRGDVLSILLEARDDDGQALTDRQLRDEIMTLMLAGHETTANLLAWTWYALATHPEVRARLEAELDAVLAGRPPTFDDLARLPYTAQILDEALRLYPPAYVVGRMAERTVQLGGATVAPGDIVLVSIRAMHHCPVYWDEPEAFRPERFADRKARTSPGYLPWGGGPRVCIGNHFALVEAQLVLATWAQRFRFRLAQPAPITPEPLVTLRPRGGVWVEVEPR